MSYDSDLIATDIHSYLAQHECKQLLRFLTCGNVDDGKSTLIGRLLHDSKMIYEDQLAQVKADSIKSGTTGNGKIDLALLVDGLQAEREQGITIDVAYRYFSTSTRKFIIADTPGHQQYTRNMATGASNCDLAVILIDARHGVQTQTKRHSFIVSLLGIKHIVVAINKMDLVNNSEAVFKSIQNDYLQFIASLNLADVHFIPISALEGDNVVYPSNHMPWYTGKPLLELLNTIEITNDRNFTDARFPVQYVNRPNLDFRGFAGSVAAGVFRKDDTITVWPSGQSSTIKSIVSFDGNLEQAFAGMAVTLTLSDEIDISRGDMIVGQHHHQPKIASQFNASLVWMSETSMVPGRQYQFKLATRSVTGSINNIHYRIDVNNLEQYQANMLQLNEIGFCSLTMNAPVVFDAYATIKTTGSFIVIDRLSNITVAAGLISDLAVSDEWSPVNSADRAQRFNQQASIIGLTGQQASQIAYQLERKLFDTGHACMVLELNNAEIASTLKKAGLLCLALDLDAVHTDFRFDCDQFPLDYIYENLQQSILIK